jgi:small subunit ribosomal protein S27e
MSSDWDKLIPRPKSRFIEVECPKCSNTQIIFSHSSRIVKCHICGETLAEPTGGKAIIKGEIKNEYG